MPDRLYRHRNKGYYICSRRRGEHKRYFDYMIQGQVLEIPVATSPRSENLLMDQKKQLRKQPNRVHSEVVSSIVHPC